MQGGRRPRVRISGLGILIATSAVVVAVALAVGALHVARTVVQVSSAPLRDIEVRVLPGQAPATGLAGRLARGERVGILLLGYGGEGHDGAFLTDSVMVVSLDPARGRIAMLSVPRDLRVALPPGKYAAGYEAKVNEAFAVAATAGDRDEGIRLARLTLGRVLGLEIDRVVAVDFRGFRAAVDAVGGIDLTVERAFASLYPRNDDASVDPSWVVVSFRAGPQHFDGEAALRFTRARYSEGPEGSDFARAARQQQVLVAFKEKALSTNAIPRLFSLLDAVRGNVRTDLSVSDLQALVDYAREHRSDEVRHVVLSPSNVLQDATSEMLGYVLVPKTEGWGEVHAFVRRSLEYAGSLNEDPLVIVRAAAARAATGASAVRRLVDLGFRARLELVREEVGRTTVADGTSGRAAESARFLADYFADAPFAPNGGGDFVVYLGRDWSPPRELALPREEPTPTPTATPKPTNGAPPSTPSAPSRTPAPSDVR